MGGIMATQFGYFLIADITGYTQYLSGSELDHAQQTLTALLNLLIRHTQPPLIISRLAGDAVISYGLRDSFLQGQTFAEAIEDTYVDFRRAIERMVRNTTCQCNACRNIGSLDLKFFVHYGEFSVQKLDAHDELVGSDVILIHRLLKNHVTEQLGLRAYTLYTDAALRQLGLEPGALGAVAHEESYENFPPATVWVEDMHPVWEAKRELVQVTIPPEQELFAVSAVIGVSRERLWDYLIQPEHYNVLLGATKVEIGGRQGGRVTTGSVFQCYHGDAVVSLTVLEWQPFRRIVTRYMAPVPVAGVTGLSELRLEDAGADTRLTQVMSKTTGPLLGRLMADTMFRTSRGAFERDMGKFKRYIEGMVGDGPGRVEVAAEAVGRAARESLVEVG
jgi:hypothetical protein